jgi:pyruvate dehydrogenase E1 component beta subunit
MRPVLEIQFSDFITLAMEQIVNQAAKIRFMFGGKASVPMVVRLPAGSGTGAAAQHSQSLEAWFAHVPGLKVVQPSTPHDAKGLLLAAIDDPNPVLIFEHKLLYKTKGPVPAAPYRVPIGQAIVRRQGRDVTIVGASIMTLRALAAAERLAREGVEAEVIDLRSLRPIDFTTIAASVAKTGRLVIVYEGVKTMGIGAEIAARVAEDEVFRALKAPIVRLGGADSPIPYNPVLEKATVPQEDDIFNGRATTRRPGATLMAIEVILPKVDMDMESGAIVEWKVAEGDLVNQGDILFEMETNKAMMEVEAPGTGVIRNLAPVTGEQVPVGTTVAWIDPSS